MEPRFTPPTFRALQLLLVAKIDFRSISSSFWPILIYLLLLKKRALRARWRAGKVTFRDFSSVFILFYFYSGVPAHRQPLVDFANLITKKLSLLICAHVNDGNQGYGYLEALRSNVNVWLKDHHIKAFFNAVPSQDFEQGAIFI